MGNKTFNNHIYNVFFTKFMLQSFAQVIFHLYKARNLTGNRKRVSFLYFVDISHESTALIKNKTIQYFL